MKRRWPWILGGAILIGLAAVVFLAVSKPGPPFMFLDGIAPIMPEEKTEYGIVSTYTWKADWKKTVKAAANEMRQRGFEGPDSDEIESDIAIGMVVASRGPNDVVMLSNIRMEYLNGKWTVIDDPLWITAHVRFSGPDGPSPFDRIKALFGR